MLKPGKEDSKEESKKMVKTRKKKAKPPTTEIKTNAIVKKVKDLDKELLIFRCTTKVGVLRQKCGNVHFRHAGYMEVIVPFMKSTREGRIQTDSLQVKVCTTCKTCYVYVDQHYYDVTKDIDLKAWEKVEKELHKATGDGGQC